MNRDEMMGALSVAESWCEEALANIRDERTGWSLQSALVSIAASLHILADDVVAERIAEQDAADAETEQTLLTRLRHSSGRARDAEWEDATQEPTGRYAVVIDAQNRAYWRSEYAESQPWTDAVGYERDWSDIAQPVKVLFAGVEV